MFRKKPASPTLPPEWLIVGLGNPGPEYARTRHNVGFELIDVIAEKAKIKRMEHQFKSTMGRCQFADTSIVIAKPLTFMNLSGQAVKPLLKYLSLDHERLIVIADDLDLPLGKVRIRESGGAGGHNGHRSIIQNLGTQDYIRIKIGVGSVEKEATVDHVLGKFHPEERPDVNRAIEDSLRLIEIVLRDGVQKAMASQSG